MHFSKAKAGLPPATVLDKSTQRVWLSHCTARLLASSLSVGCLHSASLLRTYSALLSSSFLGGSSLSRVLYEGTTQDQQAGK